VLPIKTTFADIDAVLAYVRNQVGWVAISQVKSVIDPTHADNRKIEAMKYLGLIERDGNNIKLTPLGRDYATADLSAKQAILRQLLEKIPLYNSTVQWMHHNKKTAPSKTEVANYWHDHHTGLLSGATGAALTDGAIFFLRVAGAAGLGQFVAAGTGRDTHLKVDSQQLQEYAEGGSTRKVSSEPLQAEEATAADNRTKAGAMSPLVTASPGVHINVEIHIAADAKPATVEEIFKNMQKYILSPPPVDES
jgi:hypothetical protein